MVFDVKLIAVTLAFLSAGSIASASAESCASIFQETKQKQLAPESRFRFGEGFYAFRHGLRRSPKDVRVDFESPTNPQSPILKLPSVSESPFPNDFANLLERSADTAQIRRLYKSGRGLKIDTPGHATVANGETIQLQFIGKVIHSILPDAQMREFDRRTEAPDVQFTISDTFESSYASAHGMNAQTWHFEMLDTKKANPALGRIDKKAIRSAIGLPDDLTVASLTTSLYTGTKALRALLGSILRARPHLVIVSQASNTGIEFLERDLKGEYLGYRVIRLSTLDQVKLSGSSKFIVLNDIAGRMPYVYGLADVAVTYGGINLNEPLLAGTRTFIFDESSVGSRYDKAAFATAISLAEATGGASRVSTNEELTASLQREFSATTRNQITPPYLVRQAGYKSPFEQLANKIRNILFLSATGAQKEALLADPLLKRSYIEALESYLTLSTREIISPRATYMANVNLEKSARDVLGTKLILSSIGNLTRMAPPENYRQHLASPELERIRRQVRAAIEALQNHIRTRDFALDEARDALRALDKWIE